MKKIFPLTVFISVFVCLCAGIASGQPFPDQPIARLGRGAIHAIAYSPDGKLLAAAGNLGIWLYDGEDLTDVGRLEEHLGGRVTLTFSPDGKTLASADISYDSDIADRSTVRLWDVNAQTQIGVLEGHTGHLDTLTFSPDGKFLASGNHEGIWLWDVEIQQKVAQLPGDPFGIHFLTFSPDGESLISGNYEGIRFWDVKTQQQVDWLPRPGDNVHSFAISPDGQYFAWVFSFYDYSNDVERFEIRLWEMESRQEVGRFPHETWVESIATSPDGKTLASGTHNSIQLWDIEKQQQIGRLRGDFDAPSTLAISPDGSRLVSFYGGKNTIRLWDIPSLSQVAVLEKHIHPVSSIAFFPDSRTIAIASEWWSRNIHLWDVPSQQPVGKLAHEEPVRLFAISPDGNTLASGSWMVQLWDLKTRQPMGRLEEAYGVLSLLISDDGKWLVSGSRDWNIQLWDIKTRQQVGFLEGHVGEVVSLAISPDGKWLASGDAGFVFQEQRRHDPTIRLWDIEAQQNFRFWDLKAQEKVKRLRGHTEAVTALVFGPDGEILASGSRDNTIRLWDIKTEQQVGLLEGHDDDVSALVMSHDGKWLISGSWDKTVRIWDIETQQQVSSLNGHTGGVSSLAISSDGKILASGSADGTVLLWQMSPDAAAIEPKEKQFITLGGLKRTALLQNYPNPFNPETWIPFALSETADVEIRIYSANGHLMRALQLGRKEPGIYQSKGKAAYWDGKNDAGEAVSSGVYFYQLRAGSETFVRKAMLLK